MFAQIHDKKINERGFTISAFKSTDAGTVACGIQPLHEAGITYHGKIWLEVKTSTTNSQSVKIFIPGFLSLGVVGVVIYFYQKRRKGRYVLKSRKRKVEKKEMREKGKSKKRKVDKKERRQNGKLTKRKVKKKESREKEKSRQRKVEKKKSRGNGKSRK